jgi:putative ABC transport system permease protein
MPDWKQYVREHLPPLGLGGAREAEIREELAQQLDDAHTEALALGATEEEAAARAAAQIRDWDVLARELREAEQPVAERVAERLDQYSFLAGSRQGMGAPEGQGRGLRMRFAVFMSNLWQDARYGVRMLRKNAGFTVVIVLTLALGIGANTAIFSVVNAVLLQPLPYKDSGQLVQVWEKNPKKGFPQFSVSPANFMDWKEQSHSFAQMAAIQGGDYTLTGIGEPSRLHGVDVSTNLFSLLETQVQLGRDFLPGEDKPGAIPVVIISNELWQGRLGGDPNVLGTILTLDAQPCTIVGVMPPGFHFPNQNVELWTPLVLDERALAARGAHWLAAVARLKPGVSIVQAQAEMDTIASRLEKQYPDNDNGWGITLVPLRTEVIGHIEPSLLLLMGAVGLVLLIACANVANLLMARASGRMREMAIRAALGAGRARILRQLLTESLLLAFVGSALGLLLAGWGTDFLLRLDIGGIPRQSEVGIHAPVLWFSAGAAFLAAILFGLLPALHSSVLDLNICLKEGLPDRGRGGSRLRRLLVVSEMALAVLLLVGAGLLVRSFARLLEVHPGFQPANLLTLRLDLPDAKYSKKEDSEAFYRELLGRVRNLPGVESAAAVSRLPLNGANYNLEFFPEGRPPAPNERFMSAEFRVASPDYFRTMGIALLRGRAFTDADAQDAPLVAVINEAMARQFWPNADPIGQRIIITDRVPGAREIVGVVGDVKHYGLAIPAKPEMYVPEDQKGWGELFVVVRGKLPSSALASAVSGEVHALDKDLPVFAVRSMDEIVVRSVGDQRFAAYLFALFAALALILAAVGIYGVMSHAVALGTHEIGIRMALGAQPGDVLGMVLRQGLKITLTGVGIGVAAALALTRLLASQLFGVTPTDPLTFLGVSVLLTGVALLACYLPARRATCVDPLIALRYE